MGLQRAIWWIKGEALPAGAAYLLTKLGLDSKLAPSLIRYLTNIGTHNPESNSFVIGSYDAYIQTGQSTRSSFYSLPETTYSILKNAGNRYWQAPNGQFMNDMMNAGKQLFIDQAEGTRIGNGLLFELQMITNYWK